MKKPEEVQEFTSSTEMGASWLNVAARVPKTEAEGPGVRFALWVQGCPLRCGGCCNPHMLEDREAELVHVDDMVEEILSTQGIEGVTLIGGEPFWQAAALRHVAERVRAQGLSVMVFTGLTLKYIKRKNRQDWNEFLEHIDLLIDGPFIENKLVTDRRWIGSSNQNTRFLTDRYAHMAQDEEGWDKSANTIEIRMVGNQITINGFPDDSIVRLSKASIKPKRVVRALPPEEDEQGERT